MRKLEKKKIKLNLTLSLSNAINFCNLSKSLKDYKIKFSIYIKTEIKKL